MWMMRRKSAEELDSILYFLSNALTSVIDDNSYLAHHGATMPHIGAGLATAEIASRLAMFREQVVDVSEREFMVVTKLARARHWAQELRRHEPHLRADIDGFLAATASCERMVRNRTPDAQSVFDGQAQPKRFLADRVPGGPVAAEAALSLMERLATAERGDVPETEGPRYLIGGEMSVEALNDACERLLSRLSVHYGWETGEAAADNNASDATGEKERGAAMSESEQGEASEEPDTVSAATSSQGMDAIPEERANDAESAPAPDEGKETDAEVTSADVKRIGVSDGTNSEAATEEAPRAEKAGKAGADTQQDGEQDRSAATASG